MIMKTETRKVVECLKRFNVIKVVVLAGSMGRGYADRLSDIDFYVYYNGKLPSERNRERLLKQNRIFDSVFSSGSLDFFVMNGRDGQIMWIETKFLEKMVKLLSQGVFENNVERHIAHFIQNVKVLHDSHGFMKKWRKKTKYKEKMRKTICETNDLGSISNLYREGTEIFLKRKTLFMLDWKMNLGVDQIIRIIYSLNRKYYSEYPNWLHKDIEGFRIKPKRFYERITEFSLLSTRKDLLKKLDILRGLLCETRRILEKEYPEIKTCGKVFPEYRSDKWHKERMKEIEKMVRESKL